MIDRSVIDLGSAKRERLHRFRPAQHLAPRPTILDIT
jgi:hypothetical protein